MDTVGAATWKSATLLLLAILLFPTFMWTAFAAETTDTPNKLAVTCNPTSTPNGRSISYSGSGFTPSGFVSAVFWVTGYGFVASSITADGNGAISGSFYIDRNIPPNTHTFQFTDKTTNLSVSCSIEVVASWQGLGGASSTLGSVAITPTSLAAGNVTYAFVRGTDGAIYYYYLGLDAPSGSGWRTFGGSTPNSPSATICNKGRYVGLYLFVRGSDNGVYYRIMDLGAFSWSSWLSLPGATLSTPMVASSSRGCEVVVRGADSAVYSGFLSGSSWSGWTGLGGATNDQPSVGFYSGELYVAVHGSDGGVYVDALNTGSGSWSGWLLVNGGLTKAPPTLYASNGASSPRLDLVVVGTDGAVYDTYTTGSGWASWASLGGSTTVQPSVVSFGNRLYVVVRGLDNAIYYRAYDLQGGSWLVNWTPMGGATNLPITATSNSDHIDFLAIGTDSAIYRYYQTT